MKVYYCDHFVLPLPPGHRFPMEKYRRLRERVAGLGGVALRVPERASRRDLERAHDPAYVERVFTGALDRSDVRRIGFPWSHELVERSRRSVGGTLSAARSALLEGLAVNLAGGTHHAFHDHGEGFCVFNDVAVASLALLSEGRVGSVAVVDLDVHQGNGTASLFSGDPRVFTCSVHGANNYPFVKVAGDLDVALPDGTSDDAYLEAVTTALSVTLDRPADVLFYVAGADPHERDRLGRLTVGARALAERDRMVFAAAGRRGVPVAVVMGGGYGRDVSETVDVHGTTVLEALAAWRAHVLRNGARGGEPRREGAGMAS